MVVPATAGVTSLTLDQVQSIFSGRVSNWQEVGGGNLPVQVWTYSADADVEGIFDDIVLKGEPITSLARLAVSVQFMSDAIGSTSGSIGVLPRRALDAKVRDVYTAASVPVLAITKTEPQGAVKDLLACAQAGK